MTVLSQLTVELDNICAGGNRLIERQPSVFREAA